MQEYNRDQQQSQNPGDTIRLDVLQDVLDVFCLWNSQIIASTAFGEGQKKKEGTTRFGD